MNLSRERDENRTIKGESGKPDREELLIHIKMILNTNADTVECIYFYMQHCDMTQTQCLQDGHATMQDREGD